MVGGEGGDGGNDTFIEFAGRANIPLQNGWNVEPDLYFGSYSDSDDYWGGVVHLYKRMANSAAGVFGGARSFSGGDVDVWAVGVEAQTYSVPNSIVGARAHYADSDSGSDWIQGEFWWDYFITPNTKVTADFDAWIYTDDGVGGEGTLKLTRRFEGTKVSGFIAANAGSDDGFEWYEGSAGLTWNFDPPGTTQYQHDMLVPFTQNSL